jgi:16S rRNA (guanine527-N7)-methyltransferase
MFHVKHEGWRFAASIGVPLGDEAIARLERFEQMLLDRAVPMGMVSSSDTPRLRERHVLDCLRAAPLLPRSGRVCDLGSGAGLPGIVLAIARPDLPMVLIEVRRNRAAFLEDCVRRLRLAQVSVHDRPAETFREEVDVCLARAFGSAAKSWEAAQRMLVSAGVMIYWAGQSFDPDRDLPEGVDVRLFSTPALARSGPLVIMARQ